MICDRCPEDLLPGDAVVVGTGTYCHHCAFIVAAETLATFLTPAWTPELTSILEGERALQVMKQLVPVVALQIAVKVGLAPAPAARTEDLQ